MSGPTGRFGVDTEVGLRDLLLRTARQLGSASEARWVVEQAIGCGANAVVLAGRDATVGTGVADDVSAKVARRLAGEPLQYVLGTWAFRSLELAVDPRVLIPRPETEVVVGHALAELARAAADDPTTGTGTGTGTGTDPVVAVDLGTGSGAIALALAVEGGAGLSGRSLQVWAVDESPEALAVAAANERSVRAAHPGAAPVHLVEGDWFDALPEALAGRITLVVANPPYVSETEWIALDPEVRDHEPRRALVGGSQGTEAVDRIVADACRWLAPWGVLVVELAPHQADDAALHALACGFDGVLVRPDLAGRSRALIARRWGGA